MSVSGYSIAVDSITEELQTSQELALAGISLFTLTFGWAPLILAPLSEVWGRRWICIGSAVLFWLLQIPQALARNIETVLIARFLSGIGGSTAISLVGGTLSDLFKNEDRGMPMAVFSFCAFASTGLGPVIFGYVAQNFGFRKCFWMMFGLAGAFTLALILVQEETCESALLSRKARKLRQSTGDERFVAQADAERASLATIVKISLTRPLRLFCTEPILQAFSLWVSFAWCVLYFLLLSPSITFASLYKFNIGEIGLSYIAQIIASFLGIAISLYMNKLYHRDVGKLGPEARMWAGMVGGVLFPVGSWILTWTSSANVHWIMPMIGIVILYAGLELIYLTGWSESRQSMLHILNLPLYCSLQLRSRLLYNVCCIRISCS